MHATESIRFVTVFWFKQWRGKREKNIIILVFPFSFRALLPSSSFIAALGHLLEGRGDFSERLEGLYGDGLGLFIVLFSFFFFLKREKAKRGGRG